MLNTRTLVKEFQMLTGRVNIQLTTVSFLTAKLETATTRWAVNHKYVGPAYTITAYDEANETVYIAVAHTGTKKLWLHFSKCNPNVEILNKDELFKPARLPESKIGQRIKNAESI